MGHAMRSSIQRHGAAFILADAELPQVLGPDQFDPAWWFGRDAASSLDGGRGGVTAVRARASHPSLSGGWVLRHYRRGGHVAQILGDRYLRVPNEASRAFREWRLLASCIELALPVPRPVAACVTSHGPFMRQDLLTWQIPDAKTLSEALDDGDQVDWEAVGGAIGRCHGAGLEHADLNAHNILLSVQGVTLIDLDRGRLRNPGIRWQESNLRRLRRSLDKLARQAGRPEVDAGWAALLRGHRSSS
jgi:3-deoxy-D-manno-octulosonic acid kinase